MSVSSDHLCPNQEDLLWTCLSSHATAQLGEFSGRHLSNVAWSLATMARSDEPLLIMLSYEIMLKAQASELSPQSLANVLWSFAFLAMWESKMMLAPLQAVEGYAESFNARDLSNTLWALSLYKAWDVYRHKTRLQVELQGSNLLPLYRCASWLPSFVR